MVKKLSGQEKEIKDAQEKIVGKNSANDNKKKKVKESEQLKKVKQSREKIGDLNLEQTSAGYKKAEDIIESLEDAISKEKIPKPILDSQYTKELSHEPVQVLYDQMNHLKQSVEQKGYLNSEEQKQVQYVVGAIEHKLDDHDAGKYSFTESVAMKASLIHKIGVSLKGMYKGNTHKDDSRMYQTQ